MNPFDKPIENPLDCFREWLQEAEKSEPNDPTAAALGTATKDGVPSVRMVLTKGADDRGVRFFTNRTSQKGQELSSNPHASLCFHWKSLRRQVRFDGRVEMLGHEETAAYFHSRSRRSQIAAAVSDQSQPLASRGELDAKVGAYAEELGDEEVPLPDSWIGLLLVPHTIEFWSDGPDRLHDRMQFQRSGEFSWSVQRLYP